MTPETQKVIQDLLENTRKTDRNAVLISIVLAFQTVLVAHIENRIDTKVDECRARIGLVNQSD